MVEASIDPRTVVAPSWPVVGSAVARPGSALPWARASACLWLAALVVLLAMPTASWAQPPPRAERDAEGLTLTSLPPILKEESVREHLSTGLTTTFLFSVTGRDASGLKIEGAARVEVRYELWDEVYRLVALGIDGRLVRAELETFESLVERWRALELTVLPAHRSPARIRVKLDVIPFSRGEQRDTQRWFSESMDKGGGNAEKAGQVSDERPEALGEVLHLLMATSIQRRSVQSFTWQVPVRVVREGGS